MSDSSEAARPIGDLIDALGITAELSRDDLVSDAVVLLKINSTEHGTYAKTLRSDGCDWITTLGLLEIAKTAEKSWIQDEPEED